MTHIQSKSINIFTLIKWSNIALSMFAYNIFNSKKNKEQQPVGNKGGKDDMNKPNSQL